VMTPHAWRQRLLGSLRTATRISPRRLHPSRIWF